MRISFRNEIRMRAATLRSERWLGLFGQIFRLDKWNVCRGYRGGSGCLDSISASISGTPAGFKLPSEAGIDTEPRRRNALQPASRPCYVILREGLRDARLGEGRRCRSFSAGPVRHFRSAHRCSDCQRHSACASDRHRPCQSAALFLANQRLKTDSAFAPYVTPFFTRLPCSTMPFLVNQGNTYDLGLRRIY